MYRAMRIVVFLCLASPLFAQQANITSLVPIADGLNLQTLQPVISIPIRSKTGPIPFSASFSASPSCTVDIGSGFFWDCGPNIGGANPDALSVSSNLGWELIPGNVQTAVCSGNNVNQYYDWYVGDVSGNSWHPLSSSLALDATGCAGSISGTTLDGSGFTVSATTTWNGSTMSMSGTITDKFGNVGSFSGAILSGTAPAPVPVSTTTDPFSNTLTYSVSGLTAKYVDALNPSGYAAEAVTNSSGITSAKYLDATGTTQNVTQNTTNTHITSNFGCSTITDESGLPATVVSGFSFPDGTSTTFSYESVQSNTITGRISSIQLRTGGTVQFTYGNMDCTWYRPLSVSTVGADGTTTHVVSVSGSNAASTTTVRDPGGNKTIYNFTGYTKAQTVLGSSPSLTNIPVLTEVRKYQNTGTVSSPTDTLLTTDTYCYNGNTTSCSTAAVSYPVTEIQVTHLINGMSNSSKTVTFIDGGPTGGCGSGTANCYGNVTEVDIYDFGGSTPKVKTITAYGSTSGSGGSTTCTSIGSSIFGKPCYVETEMGSNTVAMTNYKYNSTGATTDRYDLTTGSNYLHTTYSPNSNGTVASVTLPSTGTISYTYSVSTGCPSSGSGLLPTKVSVTPVTGDTWSSSTSYECNGGTVTGTSDPNSNASTIAYNDSMFRLSSVADPYSFTYTPCYGTLSGGTCTASGTSISGSSTKFNSNNSQLISNKVVDTFGRPITTQVGQGPSASNFDTVSTSYGWGGTNSTNQMVSISAPCTATSGANCSSYPHSIQYDPLGRPINEATTSFETVATTYTQNDVLSVLSPAPTGENNKQTQSEYDGLGRLTSTCDISATVSGKVSCGQATGTASGIVTTISYSSGAASQTVTSTRGSESRTATSDALGRITSENYPETAGTNFTYTYDATATATCSWTTTPNLAGHLALSKDPNGNNLCYSYDAIGRVTQVNANGTNCRHYYYDNSSGYSGTIPTGVSVANNLGQMVEAATDTCASNTLVTDEWFSYDKNGRMTDLWEYTPVKTTYYHTSLTYYPNGTPNTLTMPTQSTAITYGLDGEGRFYSAKLGTENLVSSATYDNADAPLNIAIGSSTSTDADAYTYDTNENMKTYSFTAGGLTNSASLTWNGNNTLGSLAITDGFNSANTQTCAMSYDDLARIVGDNCGTVYADTYSYDQYDNLNKSGSNSWSATYNTNNQYTTIGATYDSNGDLTYDGSSYKYTYDGFGKVSKVENSGGSTLFTMTYDAFGRVVANGATTSNIKEILYSPLGTTVLVSGSLYDSYISMPGGGLLSYNGSAAYFHNDWLGSARVESTIATSGNGSLVFDESFSPYGDEYNAYGTGTGNPTVFAGDTSEAASSLLYETPNRELSPPQSRWLSPDPARNGWNLYAYGTNPNTFIDPSGLGGCGDVGEPDCLSGNPGFTEDEALSFSSPAAGCYICDLSAPVTTAGISQNQISLGSGIGVAGTNIAPDTMGAEINSMIGAIGALLNDIANTVLGNPVPIRKTNWEQGGNETIGYGYIRPGQLMLDFTTIGGIDEILAMDKLDLGLINMKYYGKDMEVHFWNQKIIPEGYSYAGLKMMDQPGNHFLQGYPASLTNLANSGGKGSVLAKEVLEEWKYGNQSLQTVISKRPTLVEFYQKVAEKTGSSEWANGLGTSTLERQFAKKYGLYWYPTIRAIGP